MHVQCDRVGDRREEVGQYADTVNMLAETTLDYSLITKAVILELDEGAPLEVADAVGGGVVQFYSLRTPAGVVVSACAARMSRRTQLSIRWIATREQYRGRGLATHMEGLLRNLAVRGGMQTIQVLRIHTSSSTAYCPSPFSNIHHSLPTAPFPLLMIPACRSLLTAHCSLWLHLGTRLLLPITCYTHRSIRLTKHDVIARLSASGGDVGTQFLLPWVRMVAATSKFLGILLELLLRILGCRTSRPPAISMQ